MSTEPTGSAETPTSVTLLQTIFEQAGEGILLSDAAGHLLAANPQACHMLGYTQAELLGRTWQALVPPAELAAQPPIELPPGQKIIRERHLRRKDGSLLPVEISLSALADDHRLALVRDITERKEAEAVQAKLEEQLRQAQKMESVGRLAGGIAHDFNNLLTIIQGYAELMYTRMAPGDVALRRSAEQIIHAAHSATGLTRQLLAFSRKQILAPILLDLNELVTNLQKMLQRLIGEDITLEISLAPEVYPLLADPGQLEQVLLNLALNARDAMPTDGQLTIQTSNVELDQAYQRTHPEAPLGPAVMLAVTDTGHGMDAKTKAHIFEPFFTTKGLGHGTGLGLATVHGIVKQSGGDIFVYSEPGRGTTFKIYLPAAKTAPAPVLPASNEPEEISGGSETILLVEDDDWDF